MTLSKSLVACTAFKAQNVIFIGNESKWKLFLTYSDLKKKVKLSLSRP